MTLQTFAPADLKVGQIVEVLASDPTYNYTGKIQPVRQKNIPMPGPDWRIVEELGAMERIGRRGFMCIHTDGLRGVGEG